MNRYVLGFLSAVVALLGLILTAFVMQNMGRAVDLSLNLGVVAWQTSDPMPVPLLMAICLGIGAIFGMIGLSVLNRPRATPNYDAAGSANW